VLANGTLNALDVVEVVTVTFVAFVAVVAVVALPVVFWLNVGQVNVPVLKSPDCGVPKIGVVKLGDVANATTVPDPVVEYDVPHAVPVELGMPAPGYVMGRVLVIVKLGYVPDVLMPVPPVSDTVWSGAVLVNVTSPVAEDTDMPVPAIALVTPVLVIVIDPAPSVMLIAVPSVRLAFFQTPAVAS